MVSFHTWPTDILVCGVCDSWGFEFDYVSSNVGVIYPKIIETHHKEHDFLKYGLAFSSKPWENPITDWRDTSWIPWKTYNRFWYDQLDTSFPDLFPSLRYYHLHSMVQKCFLPLHPEWFPGSAEGLNGGNGFILVGKLVKNNLWNDNPMEITINL